MSKKPIVAKKKMRGLLAPSTISVKKKIVVTKKVALKKSVPVIEPKTTDIAKKAIAKAKEAKALTPGQKRLEEAAPKIAANSKKKAGKAPHKPTHKAQTPEDAARIHSDYMEYLQKHSRPRWGNTEMDPDAKGMDGASDLRLLPHIVKEMKFKTDKAVIVKAMRDQDQPTIDLILTCIAYNAWLWSNYATRLMSEAMNADPPIRTVLGLPLSQIIPGADYDGMLDFILPHMLKNSDVVQAFKVLGSSRTKVRMLPIIETPIESLTVVYSLYDILALPRSAFSIWGVCAADNVMKWSKMPRDAMIVRTSSLAVLDKAAEMGLRVILSWKALKGDMKLVKEVRASEVYSTLKKSWGGLTPLISLPIASKMEVVSKVSALGDILVI